MPEDEDEFISRSARSASPAPLYFLLMMARISVLVAFTEVPAAAASASSAAADWFAASALATMYSCSAFPGSSPKGPGLGPNRSITV